MGGAAFMGRSNISRLQELDVFCLLKNVIKFVYDNELQLSNYLVRSLYAQ